MTPPNADEDVDQQELSFIAGGSQNGTAIWEDGLVVFFFFKKKLNIQKTKTKPGHTLPS